METTFTPCLTNTLNWSKCTYLSLLSLSSNDPSWTRELVV